MIERLKPVKDPFHLIRCFGQLAIMYANEQYRAFVDMIDDATDVEFGDTED